MMVQIIPRVIFTLPSTISKKENDLYNLSILIFLFIFTFCTNGDQLDSLAGDEIESFVDIGNFVESEKLHE